MDRPAGIDRRPGDLGHVVVAFAEGEALEGIDVIVQRQAELLEIVRALDAPRRFARGLHGG